MLQKYSMLPKNTFFPLWRIAKFGKVSLWMITKFTYLTKKLRKKTLVVNAYLSLLFDFIPFLFLKVLLNFHVFMFAICIGKLVIFLHFKMCHTCVNIFTYPTSTPLIPPKGKVWPGWTSTCDGTFTFLSEAS